LSQTEAATDETVASNFAALDVDGDGYVTKREYTARMKKDKHDEPQARPMPDNPRDPY
jgi:Ca2+-binding EF-hand superfamily protein